MAAEFHTQQFKPYQPKKGEAYMNPKQLEHFRKMLSSLKDELSQDIDRTVHTMQDEATIFADPNDRASQESDMALELRKPLVPLRKPGKLPYSTHSFRYDLEYGSAELHVHTDAIPTSGRVLLVDDVLATGGTMAAACKLVERAGGIVAGCTFLIELSFLNGREQLRGRDCYGLITY